MNKADIINAAAQKTGMSKDTLGQALNALVQAIADGVAAGQVVKVGGLGVFERRSWRPRRSRNPQTGEPVDVPAKRRVGFRAARDLKARL